MSSTSATASQLLITYFIESGKSKFLRFFLFDFFEFEDDLFKPHGIISLLQCYIAGRVVIFSKSQLGLTPGGRVGRKMQ